MRFIHVSDVHLGYQQYGLKERFNDFSQTFLYSIKQAVEQQVDFVLLAGDLFEKRTVDPLAMPVPWRSCSLCSWSLAVGTGGQRTVHRDATT